MAEPPGLIPWYPGVKCFLNPWHGIGWVAPQAPKAPAVPLPYPFPENPVQHRQDLYIYAVGALSPTPPPKGAPEFFLGVLWAKPP